VFRGRSGATDTGSRKRPGALLPSSDAVDNLNVRRLAAALLFAVVLCPLSARAAEQAAVAPLPRDPAGAGSVFRPVTLSGVFRVPHVDTALYVGTSWLVRNLRVVIVRRDGRREQLVARTDLPGAILGVRLPGDAWQADRIEYEADAVSAGAVPYVVSADALAALDAQVWWRAVAFGAFAIVGLLLSFAAVRRRSRGAAMLAVAAIAKTLTFVPWLGVIRPAPEISQPLHALLEALWIAGIASFALRVAGETPRGPFDAARSRSAAAHLRPGWLGSRVYAIVARVYGSVPVVCGIVAVNVVMAFGEDLLQDRWPLPGVSDVVARLAVGLAVVAVAAGAVRGRRPGASALLAGSILAAMSYAAVALGIAAQLGVVSDGACVLCFAMALRALLSPSVAQLSSAGASAAERSAAEPPSTESGAVKSSAVESSAVESSAVEPSAVEPSAAEPLAAELPAPESSHPRMYVVDAAVQHAVARPMFGAPPVRQVLSDGLTGVANRTAFSAALTRAFDACRASGVPLALLRLDVDHFRRYNDAHGPAAGDDALCRIASSLTATPPADGREHVVARDGGDEFCVLLPGASLEAAQAFGERIRAAVEALAIARDDVPARRLTVTIGAASVAAGEDDDPFLVFVRANAALYIGKAMGRDRVVADEPVLSLRHDPPAPTS